MQSFSHSFTVESTDLDEQGHVNNVSYLRWVQDVAIAHWLRQPLSAGFSLYEQVEWDWSRGYDAVFFIDEMRASTPWGAATTTTR